MWTYQFEKSRKSLPHSTGTQEQNQEQVCYHPKPPINKQANNTRY